MKKIILMGLLPFLMIVIASSIAIGQVKVLKLGTTGRLGMPIGDAIQRSTYSNC